MERYKEDIVMHLRVKTYLKCLQGFQSKHLAVGVSWSGLSPLAELLLVPCNIVLGSLVESHLCLLAFFVKLSPCHFTPAQASVNVRTTVEQMTGSLQE